MGVLFLPIWIKASRVLGKIMWLTLEEGLLANSYVDEIEDIVQP